MKPFITCLLILITALSAEEPIGKEKDIAKQAPANAVPTSATSIPKELALLKSFTVSGTVKQSIGSFNLEGGGLKIGSTFELDLLNLPKERIDFRFQQTPESQSTSGGDILFRAPMKVEKVIQGKDRLGIFFSANDETGKFLMGTSKNPLI